jgi:hypothetical protein
MPRTVVIAGGGRNVGKTLLAEALGEILPGCVVVKLGVHHARPEKNHLFFERGTPYSAILEATRDRAYLVIESGAILDDVELEPDLVIFLPSPEGDKAGSDRRRARADLIRGEPMDDTIVDEVAQKLNVDRLAASAIVETARAKPRSEIRERR